MVLRRPLGRVGHGLGHEPPVRSCSSGRVAPPVLEDASEGLMTEVQLDTAAATYGQRFLVASVSGPEGRVG